MIGCLMCCWCVNVCDLWCVMWCVWCDVCDVMCGCDVCDDVCDVCDVMCVMCVMCFIKLQPYVSVGNGNPKVCCICPDGSNNWLSYHMYNTNQTTQYHIIPNLHNSLIPIPYVWCWQLDLNSYLSSKPRVRCPLHPSPNNVSLAFRCIPFMNESFFSPSLPIPTWFVSTNYSRIRNTKVCLRLSVMLCLCLVHCSVSFYLQCISYCIE